MKNLRQNYTNLAYNRWQSANNNILSSFLAFVKFFKPSVILAHVFCISLIIGVLTPSILFAQQDVKKIVIDAGHGGKDEGVSGKYSNEKELSLSLALQTAKLLQTQYPQLEIILTRTTDCFVGLQERADMANKAQADLFISMHCTQGTASDSGTEVYVLGAASDASALHLAQQENASMLYEEQYKKKYKGFEPAINQSYSRFKFEDNGFQAHNSDIAHKLQNYFKYYTPLQNRGVKQAPLYLLNQLSMPAVMIEFGFLTHSRDERYLNDKSGQNNISRAIILALGDYIQGSNTELPQKTAKDKPENALATTRQKTKPRESIQQSADSEIQYKVQFLSVSQKKELSGEKYNSLKPIESYFYKGMWRYVTGNCSSRAEADKLKTKLRDKGFKGAFVVPFKNGKRI